MGGYLGGGDSEEACGGVKGASRVSVVQCGARFFRGGLEKGGSVVIVAVLGLELASDLI